MNLLEIRITKHLLNQDVENIVFMIKMYCHVRLVDHYNYRINPLTNEYLYQKSDQCLDAAKYMLKNYITY